MQRVGVGVGGGNKDYIRFALHPRRFSSPNYISTPKKEKTLQIEIINQQNPGKKEKVKQPSKSPAEKGRKKASQPTLQVVGSLFGSLFGSYTDATKTVREACAERRPRHTYMCLSKHIRR